MRWKLFTSDGKDPILMLQVHHLGTDVGSVMHFLNGFDELYLAERAGKEWELEPLPLSNADFVAEQNTMLDGEKGNELFKFWKDRLAGDLPTLEMVTNRPRGSVPTYNGHYHRFELPRDFSDSLDRLRSEEGISPFRFCLSIYQLLLYRWTGQNDICVGTPTAGRGKEYGEIFNYYVSPVVMRAILDSQLSFIKFLDENSTKIKVCTKI